MNIFQKLKDLRAADRAAIKNSEALLQEVERTDPAVDARHQTALRRLKESTEQARKLKDADRRNHYSEGLTRSFQERAAQ